MNEHLPRLAMVGTGHRAGCFLEALATRFRDDVSLVALCDANPVRLEHFASKLSGEWKYPKAPATYDADRFDTLLRDVAPDTVFVCTPDSLHASYVRHALEAGANAIVEKPIAIDAAGCNAVMDASKRTGRNVRVAFNCRYLPAAVVVKELLVDGVIGEVISGSMDYMIGVEHGATYFARWHSQKAISGGLLIHKASHHFDLMNWWLDALPESVFAFGRRGYFGAGNRHKHGITSRATHYLDADAGDDPFANVFIGSDDYRELYLAGSTHDGYRGDRSVWRDHDMDIEDAMAVNVSYHGGALFTYTLNAFSPIAGFRVALNGTRGRLELRATSDAHLRADDDNVHVPSTERCTVYPMNGKAYDVTIPVEEGSHGGSDRHMMHDLFARESRVDALQRQAGAEQGAASALIGVAANHSIAQAQPVAIVDLTEAFADRQCLKDLT